MLCSAAYRCTRGPKRAMVMKNAIPTGFVAEGGGEMAAE